MGEIQELMENIYSNTGQRMKVLVVGANCDPRILAEAERLNLEVRQQGLMPTPASIRIENKGPRNRWGGIR